MQSLSNYSAIEVTDVPVEWLPQIQLFDPYLPLFPLVYVHFFHERKRIYGFPISISTTSQGATTSIKFNFLSNVTMNEDLESLVRDHLKDRIGLRNQIEKTNLIRSCVQQQKYQPIVKDLWQLGSKIFGRTIPFVKLDEVYSIVRFIAAVGSMSGRKSEMQMLYDFISYYGEKIDICEPWNNFLFYLMPTYDELMGKSLENFPKFSILVGAIQKFAEIYYDVPITIGSKKLWTKNKQKQEIAFKGLTSSKWRDMTKKLRERGFSAKEKEYLDFLADAFNRMPARAIYFITTIINLNKENDYRLWKKADIAELYSGKMKGTGFSPKAIGCFLQQGFGISDAVPIDIWVKVFYKHVFNISSDKDFLQSFDNLGILERLLWILGQGRKTNLQHLEYNLLCTKFGTPKNSKKKGSTVTDMMDDDTNGQESGRIREANPLACYRCNLRPSCPRYDFIKDKEIILESIENLSSKRISEMHSNCYFRIGMENGVPKIVDRKWNKTWIKIDEYTGFSIHEKKAGNAGTKIRVDDLIQILRK